MTRQAGAKLGPDALDRADTDAEPLSSRVDAAACLKFMPDAGDHVIGKPRSAKLLPRCPCPRETSFDPIHEHCALELGKDRQDLEHRSAGWRGRTKSLLMQVQPDAPSVEFAQQMG
jgi:hypothetical protein